MKKKQLSDKQKMIYDFIINFTAKHGYPPSVREIGEAVGLRSPSTVHTHINTLVERGLINKDDRKTRALTLPNGAMPGHVPILGDVTAGQPILAYEQQKGYVRYSPETSGDHFALSVFGESMLNAGILDGDFVIVRKQPNAENGQIVVALLEDEATVKRYYRNGDEVWLMPENDDYEPIDGSECQILGIVMALVREY